MMRKARGGRRDFWRQASRHLVCFASQKRCYLDALWGKELLACALLGNVFFSMLLTLRVQLAILLYFQPLH